MICIPLYYIHKKNIVHRDLKPDNILQNLIGGKDLFLITDFGSSFQPNSQALTTVKELYSIFYASIERINKDEAHPSQDIWSIGIILHTLMAKKVPYT